MLHQEVCCFQVFLVTVGERRNSELVTKKVAFLSIVLRWF